MPTANSDNMLVKRNFSVPPKRKKFPSETITCYAEVYLSMDTSPVRHGRISSPRGGRLTLWGFAVAIVVVDWLGEKLQ